MHLLTVANASANISKCIKTDNKQTDIKPDIKPDNKRIGASSPNARVKFVPPTVEEVETYCHERGNSVDPHAFVSHYQSNGWLVGKTKMKDWRAAVRTWERNSYSSGRRRVIKLSPMQIAQDNGDYKKVEKVSPEKLAEYRKAIADGSLVA